MQAKVDVPDSKVYDAGRPMPGGYRDISPSEAYLVRRSVQLIDVREPAEYQGELGHVPGSELVPIATLPGQLHRWDKRAPIVVICRSGGRSAKAAELLARGGFERVMNMAGGMLAYTAARLPTNE